MLAEWQLKLAVLYEGQDGIELFEQLANKLNVSIVKSVEFKEDNILPFYLTWRNGCLVLLEGACINKPGLSVDIEHRQGEQRSWPMAKQGALAQALGRKTQTIIDATAGWGQDSLAMFRMGYQVTSIERFPVMAALLADAYQRLVNLDWFKTLGLSPPRLIQGDAIQVLNSLSDQHDCIYLDPMFPPKRKKSALAKKSIMVLRDLTGDDDDKMQLFETALKTAGKRVVVKSPNYAEPLGGRPSESFHGKLLRYDVYFV